MTQKKSIEFDGLGFSPALGEHAFTAWRSMQQELVDFMQRRAQACVKWPSDVSRCQTPQELWNEQARFLKEMVSDCEAARERVMGVLTSNGGTEKNGQVADKAS